MSVPPSSSPKPMRKLVQVVSEDASAKLLFKFPDLSKGDQWDDDQPQSPIHSMLLMKKKKKKKKNVPPPPPPPSSSSPSGAACLMESNQCLDQSLDRLPLNPRCRRLLKARDPKLRKNAHLHRMANKVLQRVAKGASKCMANKNKIKHQLASRKLKLKAAMHHPYVHLV